MEKQFALIWKKIDGQLTNEESLLFDNLLASNAEFANLHKSQLRLNKALTNTPVVIAPNSILDNVLANVQKPKVSYRNKYNSFNGIQIIAIASIAFLSLITLLGFTNTSSLTSNGTYPKLMTWLDSFTSLKFFEGFDVYSNYLLILIPFVLIYWADHFYRSISLKTLKVKI